MVEGSAEDVLPEKLGTLVSYSLFTSRQKLEIFGSLRDNVPIKSNFNPAGIGCISDLPRSKSK